MAWKIITGELCTIHWPRQRPLGRRAWLLDMGWGSITLWRCPESRLSILGQVGLLSLGYGEEDCANRKLLFVEEKLTQRNTRPMSMQGRSSQLQRKNSSAVLVTWMRNLRYVMRRRFPGFGSTVVTPEHRFFAMVSLRRSMLTFKLKGSRT